MNIFRGISGFSSTTQFTQITGKATRAMKMWKHTMVTWRKHISYLYYENA